MSRRLIQILFVAIGLGWLTFVGVDFFSHTFGDCGDDQFCVAGQRTGESLVFWRGLCVATFIVMAYRFFRKDSDV